MLLSRLTITSSSTPPARCTPADTALADLLHLSYDRVQDEVEELQRILALEMQPPHVRDIEDASRIFASARARR